MSEFYRPPEGNFEDVLGPERVLAAVRAHKINASAFHSKMKEAAIPAHHSMAGHNTLITSPFASEAVPLPHYRLVFGPKPTQDPINNIDKVTVCYPIVDLELDLQPGHDNDIKDVFIEIERLGLIERYLLNGTGLVPYRDAKDLVDASDEDNEDLYSVSFPLEERQLAEGQPLKDSNNLFEVIDPLRMRLDVALDEIDSVLNGPNRYQYKMQTNERT